MCPYEFKNKTDSWYPSDNGKMTPSRFLMVIQFIKGLLLMAKEFNIHTYPTFFLLLLIMLIPFALSGDIMNNDQSNMKIIFLISAFIIIILVYGLVKTRKRKIVINELGLLITEKEGNMKISWKEISHIFFCSTSIWGLYVKITFTNRRDPLIIDFGKSSLWSVNFYRLRIAILAFSHKKDIIVVKSNQWYLKLI